MLPDALTSSDFFRFESFGRPLKCVGEAERNGEVLKRLEKIKFWHNHGQNDKLNGAENPAIARLFLPTGSEKIITRESQWFVYALKPLFF